MYKMAAEIALEVRAPDARHQYWELRYQTNGEIYGPQPSLAAALATRHVPPAAAVLELGGAYGRNATAFLGRCSAFSLIDLSPTAVRLAQQAAQRFPPGWLKARRGDFLSDPWGAPDVVFSNFVLHLLTERERIRLFTRASDSLPNGTLFINSFLSTADKGHGVGRCIEPGTFHHEVGRFNHFFDRRELERLHARHRFQVLAAEHLVEPESINGAIRETAFWFIVAQKV